jgi:hypothetical protein
MFWIEVFTAGEMLIFLKKIKGNGQTGHEYRLFARG